ncbi:hypothetical protein F8566_44065 [Actinomadura rudentiformis]|uniref:DUF6879 domain-containing protein n=2 Tax=Actinomadura rudentiformis TaxID=359158 RepID=A0A6H9YJ61_9ACTN|nr:DUF6879 family protein [Actinomadura rudentiformis]KAB2340890.1 hypothetical protein F8566_44065 [Actinomadura rudentiformis]
MFVLDGKAVMFNLHDGDANPAGQQWDDDQALVRQCQDSFEARWTVAVPHRDHRPDWQMADDLKAAREALGVRLRKALKGTTEETSAEQDFVCVPAHEEKIDDSLAITQVMKVKRLREVRVLKGFTRLHAQVLRRHPVPPASMPQAAPQAGSRPLRSSGKVRSSGSTRSDWPIGRTAPPSSSESQRSTPRTQSSSSSKEQPPTEPSRPAS